MQFRDLENRFFKAHRSNNKPVYIVFCIIGILLSPIILLFLPLPGYWILVAPILSLQFFLSTLFFLIMMLCFMRFHFHIFNYRHFAWAINTYGRNRFIRTYCFRRVLFCAPIFILFSTGFIESGVNQTTVIRFILFLFISSALISLGSIGNVNGKQRRLFLHSSRFLQIRFVIVAIKSVSLQLIAAYTISAVTGILLIYSDNDIFDVGLMALSIFLLTPLLKSIYRTIIRSIIGYIAFFQSLSPQAYLKQNIRQHSSATLVCLPPILFLLFSIIF